MSKLTAALTAVLCIVIPCLSPLRAGEVETVRFGVVLSLSGEFAPLGNTYLEGIRLRLAAHDRNPEGIRLEMTVRDDRSSPTLAAELARELLEEDGAVAIIGSDTTDLTLAIRPVTAAAGAVLISPSATGDSLGAGGDGAFRVLYGDSFQGRAMARFLREELRLERAAVIGNRRYAYSRNIAAAFSGAFREGGGSMVAEEYYDRAVDSRGTDFLPLLRGIRPGQPQAIFLPNYAEEIIELLQQSLDLDLTGIFCGADAWDKDAVLLEAGNNLKNAYYVGIMNEDSGSPEMAAFLSLLNLSNDDHAEPASILGYDALSLLIEALRRRGGDGDLREAMYRIRDFPLATGRITMDRERGVLKPAYIIKVSDLGSFFTREVVETIHPD